MAELADALDLGSSVFRRGGSSPPARTLLKMVWSACLQQIRGATEALDYISDYKVSERLGILPKWSHCEATVSRMFTGLRSIEVEQLDTLATALGLVGWQVFYEAEVGVE